MSDTAPSTTRPRILLATDLSSRTDRALDRAAQLARQWGGELLVCHALEADPIGAVYARSQRQPGGARATRRWRRRRASAGT